MRASRGALLTELIAVLNEISPDADALVVVIGEAWRALVLGALAVPAGVENSTVGRMREDTVKTGTVWCRYGRLCDERCGKSEMPSRKCACRFSL